MSHIRRLCKNSERLQLRKKEQIEPKPREVDHVLSYLNTQLKLHRPSEHISVSQILKSVRLACQNVEHTNATLLLALKEQIRLTLMGFSSINAAM